MRVSTMIRLERDDASHAEEENGSVWVEVRHGDADISIFASSPELFEQLAAAATECARRRRSRVVAS